MNDLIPDNVSRLLLVEGPDDLVFFNRLVSVLHKEDVPTRVSVGLKANHYDGKSKLQTFIYQVIQHRNFGKLDKIWIVRDADYNSRDSEKKEGAPSRALKSVNSAIENAFRESSSDIMPPNLTGFMSPTISKPSFSLLVLPNANRSTEGSLETLLLAALRNDPMMPFVYAYFDSVRDLHKTSAVAANRLDKCRLCVFLMGKLIMRTMSRSKDAKRELPRYMYSMAWWNDDIFSDPLFNDAKAFLTQLLED